MRSHGSPVCGSHRAAIASSCQPGARACDLASVAWTRVIADLLVEAVPFDHPDAVALRVAQRAELTERYGTPDSEPGPAPTAADTTVFLLARDAAGEAVGCGALRALGDGVGEVKRMYVVPARRRSGVAGVVLAALEAEAARRGWDVLKLETGTEQPDAMAFYERHGYRRIPNFGHYADSELSVCYERTLTLNPTNGAAGTGRRARRTGRASRELA
jgi:putative acetyltransferase